MRHDGPSGATAGRGQKAPEHQKLLAPTPAFGEDRRRGRKDDGPQNVNVLRQIGRNLLKSVGFVLFRFTVCHRAAAGDVPRPDNLLRESRRNLAITDSGRLSRPPSGSPMPKRPMSYLTSDFALSNQAR